MILSRILIRQALLLPTCSKIVTIPPPLQGHAQTIRASSSRIPTQAMHFLPKHGNVPITLPDGLEINTLAQFHPLINNKDWLDTLHKSLSLQGGDDSHPFRQKPYSLKSITIKSHTMFGKRVGFAKVEAIVKNEDGETLPATVFLRGPSVAMLFMLVPDDVSTDSTERYVVLTVQPRIAAGSMLFTELPAGMVDDRHQFAGTAAKEIEEELGIVIKEEDLVCLSDMVKPSAPEGQVDEELPLAMFPSAGACDEYIKIFMHERTVPRGQLEEWKGKQTGLRTEGEKISLRIVPFKDLWREGARDSKALSSLALYEGLRREGKI